MGEDWWINDRCETYWRSAPEVRCMRPKGHEGKHRGSHMIPETVWFSDEQAFRAPGVSVQGSGE